MCRRQRWCIAFLLLAMSTAAQGAPVRLMRYPDLQGGRLAFIWASDIWIVPADGGLARQLTADGRPKRNVQFSPDGTEIGFSSVVDGNTDVYVVAARGGIPRRITHHPGADLLVDWYPDGRSLLISSPMLSTRPVFNRLFRVAASGGLPVPLPLSFGETAALSGSGKQVIYTVYRDFQDEAWKRYVGGRAPDLWYYDMTSGASRRLTDGDAPDSWPMWINDCVYYLSEGGAEQRSNLWMLSLKSTTQRQLTTFTEFDVRHPARGDTGIAFEANGRLYVLDYGAAVPREVDVQIETARSAAAAVQLKVSDRIEHVDLGADGSTISIGARGDVFSVTRTPELVTNLTRSPGIAERYPTLSPDGQLLAYFSDVMGEYQLCIRPLKDELGRVLTRFTKGFNYKPQWSPNGRMITFIDSEQAIHVTDVASGHDRIVDRDTIRDHNSLETWRASWSPDSRYLAYVRAVTNRNFAAFIFDTQSGNTRQVTAGIASDVAAEFAPEGDYLYLLSYRELRPTFGDVDPTWTYADSMGISVIPLRDSVRAPFLPDAALPIDAKSRRAVSSSTSVGTNTGLLERRIAPMPVVPGTLTDLAAVPGRLIYRRLGPEEAARRLGVVEALDIRSGRVATLARDVEELHVAARGEFMLIRRKDDYTVVAIPPAAPSVTPAETRLPLERLYAPFDRRKENRQQFIEAWRYVRDFFYDPALHGVDWPAVRDLYLPLVDEAQTDEDMSALLREMAGELAAGHVWAFAGEDSRERRSGRVGLLGVDFEAHGGAYRIARILDPGDTISEVRSPLAEPAVGVQVGDYVLAVNDVPLTTDVDPFAAFENQVEVLVKLTVNTRPGFSASRDILVRTLASEAKLRERVWVEENRARVEQLSGGRIGYIYVPDTGAGGQTDLMRQYRAQYAKEGLVIDERFNVGGALGDRFVELLNRPPLNYFVTRNASAYPLPELSNAGPKAMLTNGWSYSGGDGFPFLFKAAKVGPLIGTRTSGGLIGPSMPLPLVSGGRISVANQRVRDIHGEWAEGNHGVMPDIYIDNDAARLAGGQDQQLERAVSEVLAKLAERVSEPPARNAVSTVGARH